jgi:hypothetical protein
VKKGTMGLAHPIGCKGGARRLQPGRRGAVARYTGNCRSAQGGHAV